jgi:hypothetical protein
MAGPKSSSTLLELNMTTSTEYVLFLDDERDPPKSKDVRGKDVVHAKNIREFISAIQGRGEPFMVMFDWYLGSGEPSGLEAAQWLVDYDLKHNILGEEFLFHSQSFDREKARDIVRLIASHLAVKFGTDDADDIMRAARRRLPSPIEPIHPRPSGRG